MVCVACGQYTKHCIPDGGDSDRSDEKVTSPLLLTVQRNRRKDRKKVTLITVCSSSFTFRMSYTLHTDAGNFRAFKILIAAEYNNVEISIPEFNVGTDNITPAFLKKSPLGRVPVLDTPQGSLFESNAIARFVARLRSDTELLGANFHDNAQVDTWIDFCSHDIELPATLWYYPYLGVAPYNAALTNKAKGDLQKSLAVLEAHLADKTYVVGHKITLADISLVSALVYPFKFVAEASYRSAFPNVMRWFITCVNQPQFEAVIGKVVLCEKELALPAGGAAGDKKDNKGEKKEKAPKADKPKEEKKKEEKKPKVQFN
jgi:elongation factor 1-gamma